MIDGVEFSAPGEAPTEFEVRLLQQAAADHAWVVLGQRLCREMGAAAGAAALAAVMDELGTEQIHVPARASFFRALWREERDALVLSLSARPDWTTQDIADALGMKCGMVRHVRRQSRGGGQCPRPGKRSPR